MKTAKEILAEAFGYSSIQNMESEFDKEFPFGDTVEYTLKAMEKYANQFKEERPDNLRGVCEHEFVPCDKYCTIRDSGTPYLMNSNPIKGQSDYGICIKCGLHQKREIKHDKD